MSAMAPLLKTAARQYASGMTLSSLSVLSDGVELGRLPSKYLHTNLQHCSDVGRLAFLDTQRRMNKMHSIARSMMEDGGSVGYLLEMLEDSKDAKANLKLELEEMRKAVSSCRNECVAIRKKFEYWQLVVLQLSVTAMELYDEKTILAEKVRQEKNNARVSMELHSDIAATAKSEIEIMKPKLKGKIEREGVNIDAEMENMATELSLKQDKLAEAKYIMAKARSELYRLEKQELNDMLEILRDSNTSLGILKEQFERLFLFFSGMENSNLNKVMKWKAAIFLRFIERNIESSGANAGEMKYRLSAREKTSQKMILDAAFQIQGQFSLLADISAAHVQISNNYIRQAINRMEGLSRVSDDDWDVARAYFEHWSQGVTGEMFNIAIETSKNMENNMKKRLAVLEAKAIEARERNGTG